MLQRVNDDLLRVEDAAVLVVHVGQGWIVTRHVRSSLLLQDLDATHFQRLNVRKSFQVK